MEKINEELSCLLLVKFQDRLNYVISTLKSKGINVNLPESTKFHIEITDDISEEQIKNIILESTKTAYSPYTKTIYIHNTFVNAPQLEYHFSKRMLEHMTTKTDGDKILSGISITGENINYNHSLNQAMIESLTNTILGNETMDEDTFSKYIIERHHLGLIQNIVGLETMLNSFFNSDYLSLETQFESYGTKFKPLVEQMDTLTRVNYDLSYTPKPGEENLAVDIFTKILEAYTRKSAKNRKIENKEDFENHIINPQTVRGAFGTTEKTGYTGVEKNLHAFKSVIKGLESANKLLIEKEPTRSI